jgi:peptide/nickel transport system permease protein
MIATARNRRGLWISIAVIAILSLVAVAAPLLAPYAPEAQPDVVLQKDLPPSLAHPFGTDLLSRDVLSRVIYGARTSLSVASASVILTLVVGTGFGALAALAGGMTDRVMMRLLDIALALPRILILLAILAIFPDGLSFWAFVLVIGGTGWYDLARMVRGEMHGLLKREFVLAAAATGVRRRRLFVHHLLPHLLPVLAVSATLGVAQTIAIEAGLGFLGFGIAGRPSWGSILNDGLNRVQTQWWVTLFPAVATAIAVLACNALGDALRDVFAPEQVPA